MAVERERIRTLNHAAVRGNAEYVLYWCQANRRVESNHALAHAVEIANESGLPLLVYEGLDYAYGGASDRFNSFILEGVPEMARALKRLGAGFDFHRRKRPADPNDRLYTLAAKARCVVTDDYPSFTVAAHNSRVPSKIGIPYIVVDSSCIVPMNRHEKRAYGAYTIRPKIRRELPAYLKPLDPVRLKRRWPESVECRIERSLKPLVSFRGGASAARKHLAVFLEQKLSRYAKESNQPARHATSDLSPYLHFGHISSLEVALAVRDYAAEHKLIADEFLEQLIVRRELAFNFARFTPDPRSLACLPEWCRRTMATHAADPRPYTYTAPQLERAETHDALWNAAQKELLLRGKIHGYYRMYWGKKIVEWSPTYDEALQVMIHLHDIYALDGRDPNTYTNILWCFGLHDRPWGERPVFGQLRYMSLEGMRRKTDTAAYIAEIAELERTGKDAFRI